MSLPDPTHVCLEDDDWYKASKETLSNRARHLAMTLQHFWKRWRREYLLQLRDCHRKNVKNKPHPLLKKGDIIIVHDDKQVRGLWKLAKIERLLKGADGLVRGTVIWIPSKSASKTLRRPLRCLYPLEIECATSDDSVDAVNDDSPPKEDEQAERQKRVESCS